MARFTLRDGKTLIDLGIAIANAAKDRAQSGPGSPNEPGLADKIRECVDHSPENIKVLYDGGDDAGEDIIYIVVPNLQQKSVDDLGNEWLGDLTMKSCAR